MKKQLFLAVLLLTAFTGLTEGQRMTADTPQELYIKGNIATAGTTLPYVGDGRYSGEVTLDDSRVFLFSDKYIYFAFNNDEAQAIRRKPGTRTQLAFAAKGEQGENIRINGGTYTFTVDTQKRTWDVSAPIDEYKISAFGSSVCNGQGAKDNKGYAYLYGQLLEKRYADGISENPFHVSGVAIGGNTTRNLLDRYDEMQHDFSRYVIIGLSMGNEGVHEATDKQAIVKQFSNNMTTLIRKMKAEGKIPVVMNNYTRGDFSAEDYAAIKEMNLLIHGWDVASVNTLGAIDDGKGHWASGYQQDNAHPTTNGHVEFFNAMPPSLFDAIASGKSQPVRNLEQQMSLSDGNTIRMRGEGTVHPFTISVRVKGRQAGQLFSYKFSTGSYSGQVYVDEEGHVVYNNYRNKKITSTATLSDDEWHMVTLTHYYAQVRTLLYIDGQLAGEILERVTGLGDITLGDAENREVSRQLSEIFMWRAGMTPEEVEAVSKGEMLKSSLEVYVPTVSAESLSNLAMSLNNVEYVPASATTVSLPVKQLTAATDTCDLLGRRMGRRYKGVRIVNGRKVINR